MWIILCKMNILWIELKLFRDFKNAQKNLLADSFMNFLYLDEKRMPLLMIMRALFLVQANAPYVLIMLTVHIPTCFD